MRAAASEAKHEDSDGLGKQMIADTTAQVYSVYQKTIKMLILAVVSASQGNQIGG